MAEPDQAAAATAAAQNGAAENGHAQNGHVNGAHENGARESNGAAAPADSSGPSGTNSQDPTISEQVCSTTPVLLSRRAHAVSRPWLNRLQCSASSGVPRSLAWVCFSQIVLHCCVFVHPSSPAVFQRLHVLALQELLDEATAGPEEAIAEEEVLRKKREAEEERNREVALKVR